MSRATRIASAVAATALACGAIGAIAAPADAASSTPSAKAAACDKAPWASKVQGRPLAYQPGAAGGVYLWHSTNGFNLRVTHGKNHDERVYSGEITASAPMRIDPVKLEKGDYVKLSANRRSIVFAFANYGYIDGVNFHTDCANALEVSRLHVGNSNLLPKRVYLGATETNPRTIPFVVHRTAGKA